MSLRNSDCPYITITVPCFSTWRELNPIIIPHVLCFSHSPQWTAILHHCLFMLRAWFSIWFHREKRDQLVRTNHLLSDNLKIICKHDHPYLYSCIIHSFFNGLIYPFIWHSLILLCARHCARCCKRISEFDSISAARKGKKPLFPPQGDCFACALSGIPLHFQGCAQSTASLARVSATHSSHSASSSFPSGFEGLRFLLY